MIRRLNHIAIAVPDIQAACALYRDGLGGTVSDIEDYPDHGVRVAFVELANTKIELLYPLDDTSPIAGFLKRNPDGGIHHFCVEVDDVEAARAHLKCSDVRVLGEGGAKIGAHGKPVLFLHPKDMHGTLVELEQS